MISIRLLVSITALFMIISPAFAQSVGYDEARDIALSIIPGTVVEVEKRNFSTGLLFDIDIRQSDGTVYTIKVRQTDGGIEEKFIKSLGRNAKLPDPVLTEAEALKIAEEEIERLVRKGKRTDSEISRYLLVDGLTAYEVIAERFFKTFKIYVDSTDGKILRIDEAD